MAARLFAERGVDPVSLRDIARESGLQAGSVYFHVESKDAVLHEVMCVGIDESVAHLGAALDAADPHPAARLAAAVRAHIEARSDLSDYAAVVLGIHRADVVAANEDYRLRRGHYLEAWRKLIEAAQDVGALPPDRPSRLVRELLLGAMNTDLQDRWTCAAAADTLLAMLGFAEHEPDSPKAHVRTR